MQQGGKGAAEKCQGSSSSWGGDGTGENMEGELRIQRR